jgi:hypothetical protein
MSHSVSPFVTMPSWPPGPLALYHGTLDTSATQILTKGVNHRLGRAYTDFGTGFYTTTNLRAYAWVASKYGVAINQKIALYKLP